MENEMIIYLVLGGYVAYVAIQHWMENNTNMVNREHLGKNDLIGTVPPDLQTDFTFENGMLEERFGGSEDPESEMNQRESFDAMQEMQDELKEKEAELRANKSQIDAEMARSKLEAEKQKLENERKMNDWLNRNIE